MLLSVITVVKNNKNQIESTLLNVLNQNLDNKYFEYIVIDGVSNDGTVEIIKKYEKKIKFFSKKDKNLYEGLNNGIKLSNGKYILFLHSGDLFYDNETLEMVYETIKNNKSDIFSFSINYRNYKNEVIRLWNAPTSANYKFYNIPHTGTVISRDVYDKLDLYNENFKISSDADFLIKVLEKKYKFYFSNKVLVSMSSGGLSNSFKYYFLKLKEDLTILFHHFGMSFLIIYLKKILFKVFKNKFF